MAKVGGEEIDLTPTDGMAKEAQKGLDWRKDGHDGGTSVGLARARQLVNKQELSPNTVRRMHSFFSRHEVDKQGEGFSPGEPGFPSNGRVAWALWGGDPGQTWARAKTESLDRLEGKTIDYMTYKSEDEYSDEFGASCPAATFDDELNMANHLVCIEQANLGPADPTQPSSEYWQERAKEWLVSETEARTRLCDNCEYYNNTPKMVHCVSNSNLKASDLPVDPKWADIEGTSGYCTKWDITCTAIRTCSTWEKKEFIVEDEDESEEIDSPMPLMSLSMKKIFKLDSAIKSVEEGDTELKIAGYASTNAMDRSCDKILPTAWTKGGLRNFETNPILLFNHNYDKPIGRVVEMATDSKGLKIKGVISKAAGDVYNLVKEGVLSTFSVGFIIKDADYDKSVDGLVVKDAELLEVSVVSVPCNQDATFSVAKSFENQDEYLEFKNSIIL